MKTIMMLSVTGALVCATPALAAEPAPTSTPSGSQQCKTLQTQMGKTAFNEMFGTNANKSNAFGKCVSARNAKTVAAEKAAKTNAAKTCKAEETANPAAFKAKYGTGKNGSNAFGKCVSRTAQADTAKQVKTEVADTVSASKSCKAARTANPAAFKAKNAFGKCVSTTAKAKADARKQEQGSTPTQS